MTTPPRELLQQMFAAAVAAAQPALCIPPHLPAPPRGPADRHRRRQGRRAAMARALEDCWPGPLEGLVVTRYGYAVPCQRIEIIEASHPVPDAAGLLAAQRILATVGNLTADDTVLCLISGGGSSLLALPIDGITLEDKQAVNRELLKSGATISEMNTIRRHLSAIKGGRLASACHPAKVVTLLISDVPGDNPCDIASGPTVGDASTCEDALAIVRRYGIDLPANVREVLESGRGESVKPDDQRLQNIETRLITTPQIALEAAAKVARAAGITPYILSDAIEGEARDVGKVLGAIALQVAREKPALQRALRAALGRRNDGDATRATGAADATSNSCSRSASHSTAKRASTRWPPTPTASMGRKRSPAPTSRRTRCNAPGHEASAPRTAWTTTTATASSAH